VRELTENFDELGDKNKLCELAAITQFLQSTSEFRCVLS